VERYSEHPLARAIVAASAEPQAAGEFSARSGMGASATLESSGELVSVGRMEIMPVRPDAEAQRFAAAREALGETVVWVSHGNKVAGFVALRDRIDPTAYHAVRELVARGVTPMLLSGDAEATVRAVAAELGVEQFAARLTPELKAARIVELRSGKRFVAMVGDGVNDAPSLAAADLSITVAGGADIAGKTSDIVLTRDDLELVPWFLSAAAQTNRVIRQNLGWAVAYNAVALPLAAFGVITPGIAAAAMASSSLLVVGNSLRLRRQLRRIELPARVARPVEVHA
jgi:Cu+-exporting ATPase